MSFIDVKDNGATPANPPAGYLRIYPEGSSWKYVNSSGTVFTFSTGVTPEEVQDIVGAFFADSSTINVTYNDAGNVISADVIASAVDHDQLLNFVANEHINHASVSINAGTGLTGGGDLTATRTISMPNTGTAGTYRSVTTDAQGRVTAGTNPTTLAGYGITDAQPLDADLTALAGLAGTGVVIRSGAGTATTRTIVAGTGVSVANGDGISGNPSIGLSNVGTAGTYGSATTIPSITTNAQGQVSAVTNNLVAIPSTQVTDFNEAAQDAVGGILTDSSSIDFTYSDGGNSIQAFVIPGGVDHNGLVNLGVGDPHPQYLLQSAAATTYQPLDSDLTAVAGLAGTGLIARTATGTATTRTVTAGTGITVTNGDGVSGNPTVAITNTTVTAGTYGNNAVVPQLTVNAQGQITNVANSSIAIGSVNITDFTEAVQDVMGGAIVDSSSVDFTYNDVANTQTASVIPGGVDHNSLANLTSGDAHTQYTLLAGRAGGQTINGGTASANNLTLSSTTNATKGKINLGSAAQAVYDEVNNRIGIGNTSPTYKVDVVGTSDAVITTRSSSTTSAAFLEAKNDTTNYIEAGVYGSLNGATIFGDSAPGKSFLVSSATAPMAIGQFGNQSILLGTNNTERVKIDGAGDVTVGGIAGTALVNNKHSVNSNINDYAQSNVQNINAGASASGDFVCTANNGTDTTNYIDMGINSSGYSDPAFTINGPNDGYVYVNGGDLSLGTATAHKIAFFTGNTLAANERARITPTGQLAVGTTAPSASALVQIDSTTQGFLPPRVTTTQMNAIASPAAGLTVYNTDYKCLCTYDGALWRFTFDLVVQNNQTTTSNVYANATELVTPLLPIGRYSYEFKGVFQSTATTTGVGIRVGAGSATISSLVGNWSISQAANGTAKNFEYSQLSATDNITSASALTANADFPVMGRGVFSLSVAGTVAAQIRSEVNASGVSIRINSTLNITRMTG